MATDQIIYLEKFVDSTATLPPELQRILNLIKELDYKVEELGERIQLNVEMVLSKNSVAGRKGQAADEVVELRGRIEADQRLLIQFAEEKVQLALAGYDCLDTHIIQAEADIAALSEELAQLGGRDTLEDTYLGGYDEPAYPKRGGSRLREAPSYDDSFDALPPPPQDMKPRKTTVTLNLQRLQSFQSSPLDVSPAIAPKRTGSAGALAPIETGLGGYQPRRRAAQAAVQSIAAVGASFEDDDPMALDDPITARHAPSRMATAIKMEDGAPQKFHYHHSVPGVSGLQHAAEQPQAPGRLLTRQDVTPALVGRKAELFWPDDNLWYLVEFHSIDLATRQAQVMYTNGEAEALDLDEICKDGHMSLITQMP